MKKFVWPKRLARKTGLGYHPKKGWRGSGAPTSAAAGSMVKKYMRGRVSTRPFYLGKGARGRRASAYMTRYKPFKPSRYGKGGIKRRRY